MKLILTLLVRDEVDIIETNLDYHLNNGVDYIIATDNGSIDGTPDILKDYERSGVLEYCYQRPSDFSQYTWVSRMAQLAYSKHNADWVINSDGDELFVAKTGTLKDALCDIPEEIGAFRVNRHDFVPFERACVRPPAIEMIYRKTQSLNLKGRKLSLKSIHRGVDDVTVSQGNHRVTSSHFPDDDWENPAIDVYHYPIRSLAQFESKVRNGGSGYAKNDEMPKDCGFHKRYWYDLLLAGNLADEFKRHFFESNRLEKALASGELVKDCKVSEFLESL